MVYEVEKDHESHSRLLSHSTPMPLCKVLISYSLNTRNLLLRMSVCHVRLKEGHANKQSLLTPKLEAANRSDAETAEEAAV